MRRLRILCVLAVTIFAALALSIALENPASSANAQSQSQPQGSGTASQAESASKAAVIPAASNGIPPTIVGSNIGIRTLAAAPQANEALGKFTTSSATTTGSANEQLFLTSVDKPNKILSFLAPSASNSAVVAAISAAKQMTTVAGIGAVGSIGDGGAATSAQFDLNFSEIDVRSGVAIAADGTIYISDTGNATIRVIAGPASSEPGIIRSVAGRWAPRQNVELSEPMGIALDRAGNLFIADYGANAVDVLYGPSSPKAGQLETFAHMVAPGSVAVTLDGGTVFASSPQTGIILAISTQTHAVCTPAINAATLFASAQQRSTASRITPTGIAVDGGGNLFIAYSDPSAASDEILRLDALSSNLTVAAQGLSSPGDLSFDAKGDLFVANQGMRNIVRFNLLGAAAAGVTLTAPVSTCASHTIFCDQLIGGTSATQSYELTNNTASPLSGITNGFVSGNSGDFTVSSSSCSASLAAGASCGFNIAFTPTANASAFQTNNGTLCIASATKNSRCSIFTVNYTGATLPLTAPATGIADDFQIACVTSKTSSCFDLPDSNFDQVTIVQGDFGTFQLQIVPDDTFSGPVALVCPSNLPISPTGAVGNPTTCGLSLGTSITEPLQNTLTVNVVAGKPLAFNMTIQTTTTNGDQTPPPITPPASVRRSAALGSLLAIRGKGNGGNGSGTSMSGAPKSRTPRSWLGLANSAAIRPVAFFLACLLFGAIAIKQCSILRCHPAFSLFALALIIVTIAGCGGGNKTPTIIPFTPTGTYMLTVQGSAQSASRGYTCTLTVAQQK